MATHRSDADRGAATDLLERLAGGEGAVESELFELLRAELHRIARGEMERQARGHTLQPTALVHEAWMRLFRGASGEWQSRRHFLGVAAKAMRSVLVDHARRQRRAKRGDGVRPLPLETAVQLYDQRACDLVELDDALERLATENERQARVVELRFFAGLTIDEAAAVLGIGHATVERDWHLARIWLRAALGA